jgi:hypothetical protein
VQEKIVLSAFIFFKKPQADKQSAENITGVEEQMKKTNI